MRRLVDIVTQIIGIFFLFLAFYVSLEAEASKPQYHVIHYPSLMLVSFILLGVVFASEGLSKVLGLLGQLWTSPSKVESRLRVIQSNLEAMSDVFYKQGPSGLKSHVNSLPSIPAVWSIVINQLESKLSAPDIQLLLKYSAIQFENRTNQNIQILNVLSAMAPSAGVLGTVIGLIKLLGNLENLSNLGSDMSLALITTLYGVFYGTIVLKPFIARLENLKKLQLQTYDQAQFWVNLVNNRKPSFYLNPKYFDARDKSNK